MIKWSQGFVLACCIGAAGMAAAGAQDSVEPAKSGPRTAGTCKYDFDGDGIGDPAVFDPGSGNWHVSCSRHAGAIATINWGFEGARPVPADYDGDGTVDFAVYHRQTGYWYIMLSSTRTLWARSWGWRTARPVAADFNGDGRSEPAVYDNSTGNWYILLDYGAAAWMPNWGWGYGRPVPADYDGDGAADLAVFERDTGNWFIVASRTGTMTVLNFGWRETRPVPADYDGDGADDLAVYHAAAGRWYMALSGSGSLRVLDFGWNETRPVPGDYDGDGAADCAVYHRESGVWYICLSASGQLRQINCGSNRMTPIPCYDNGAVEGWIYLAFGDSITYGQCSASDGPETGYPRLLELALEPKYGGHFTSINAGVPGETTLEAMDRFADTLRKYHPDLLLLMEGTNDMFYDYPAGDVESRLRRMVSTAISYGIPVVMATIPPVISNRYRDRSAQEARIEAFNPRIYSIASDYHCAVAQVWESITSHKNWQNDLIDQPTANHPNDAGYAVVRDAFLSALAPGIEDGLYY